MAGKSPKARQPGPRIDKEARALARAAALRAEDPALSKSAALRAAGISEARDVRRLVAKLIAPPQETRPAASRTKATGRSRPQAAAPLRADAPKKVGAPSRPAARKNGAAKADYQPKTETELPPLDTPVLSSPLPSIAPFPNPLAIARPWMMLGVQMTLTGLSLQARMARAAMNLTPASMAMNPGANAVGAWLDAMGRARPLSSKD